MSDKWGSTSLEEVTLTIKNGTTATQLDNETHYRVTRIETISLGFIDIGKTGFILKPEPSYKYESGDIIFSRINSVQHIAKTAYFFGGFELYHGMNLTLIRPNKIKIEPKFLFHLLNREKSRSYYRAESKRAVNQVSLGIKQIGNLPIELPTLPEQRRIAEVLDTLDTVIERTEALVQKLTLARAGLLHDLLTRGLDKQGQLRDPERNPEAFKDSKLGRMPREWEVKRLDAFCDSVADGTHDSPQPKSAGHPLVTSKNLRGRELDLSDVYYISDEDYKKIIQRSQVERFDILFAMIGTVGNPVIVNTDEAIATKNVGILRLGGRQNDSSWVINVLNASTTKKQIDDLMAGSTQKFLGLGALRSLLVSVPTRRQEISDINAQSFAIDKRIKTEQAQLDKLRLLKRGLMEDLLTGRVRVPIPEERVEDDNARAAVRPTPVPPTLPAMPDMPPPVPVAAQSPAMYRASPGANPEAQGAWVEQVRAAVAGQQVGTYSPEALDALLPELAALSVEPEGILRVPELLAGVGVRFMLLAHPANSRTSGAAFYLDEPTRTQPVVALSFLRPYLDAFWFNLFHELGHIRLGHTPVFDEELGGKGYAESNEEQAANAFARHILIPEEVWQPFLAAGLHDSYRIRSFARRVGQHHGTVAGRLGTDTGDWPKFNSPELRPQVKSLLTKLAAKLNS